MQEIWEDIKGFEGYYQISNLGNVKSLQRTTKGKKFGNHKLKEKFLKPIKIGKYYTVVLCKNNEKKKIYIHRLVGDAFIENINNCTDINHKDGNPKNNCVENLEWCTRSYNIKHSYVVLKRKANLTGFIEYRENHKRKVNQYNLDGSFVKEWNCISDAEKFLNKNNTGKICDCCRNKRKTAFGYKWEYANTTIPNS